MNDMNYRKEMAVGQSKSKLSRKFNKWSCHTTSENNIQPEQQRGAAATTKEDKLAPPLLENGEELLVGLPTHLRDSYVCDFHLADETFHTGRLEATSRGRKKYWDHWQAYTAPMGVDPYLQDTQFSK